MASSHLVMAPTVELGLVLSAALQARSHVAMTAQSLADGLGRRLAARAPGAVWKAVGLVGADATQQADAGVPVPVTVLQHAARQVLLEDDLDIVVLLTERQLELHERPVVSQSSPVQHVVVRRVEPTEDWEAVLDDAADLTLELFGLHGEDSDREVLAALARVVPHPPGGRLSRLSWTLGRLGDRPGLFVREVRATRPWLLARHLTRALVGAAAAAGIAVVTPDFWSLADRMGVPRLAVVTAIALVAAVAVIVIGGNLRERGHSGDMTLHNAAVWTSVTFGVATLYVALVLVSMAVTLAVLPWGLVSQTIGHSAHWGTMVKIGALTAAAALTGSVFGAGLEEDETLKEAAFGGSDDARYADEKSSRRG